MATSNETTATTMATNRVTMGSNSVAMETNNATMVILYGAHHLVVSDKSKYVFILVLHDGHHADFWVSITLYHTRLHTQCTSTLDMTHTNTHIVYLRI